MIQNPFYFLGRFVRWIGNNAFWITLLLIIGGSIFWSYGNNFGAMRDAIDAFFRNFK